MGTETRVKGTSPIRVLFCLDAFEGPNTGGTEGQFWLLHEQLPRWGFSSGLALLLPSKYIEGTSGSGKPYVLNIRSMKNPRSWIRLLQFALYARRNRFDVAILFLNDVSVCLPPFLWIAGVKVVVSRRDMGFWYTPGLLAVLRRIRWFVHSVLVNSSAVGAVVERMEGYSHRQVVVIPNAYCREGPAAQRELLVDKAGDEYRIVVVANLKPIKRLEDVIRATKELRSRNVPARLVLVGGDSQGKATKSHQRELEEIVDRLGLVDYVSFIGRVDDPTRQLCTAHVGVLCSESEGLSNAIIEYMYAGLPTVCSDVGGNRELITEGSTGYLYPVGDVVRMSDLLERLYCNPALRVDLGWAALQDAENRFSKDTTIEAVAAHLKLVVRA